MVHSKRILAEVTTVEDFKEHDAFMRCDWTFFVPQFNVDTKEEQAIDAAFSMACALARETAIYDGLPEISKPASILYIVKWEGKTLPVRFTYSKKQKRYAMLIGDIATWDGGIIKTINSR